LIIHIEGLSFNTIIGILDFERTAPQAVVVNCDIEYSYKNNFLDYSLITQLIQTHMHEKQFELIETALLSLISKIKETFPEISNINLTIKKPDIIDNCIVSVSHQRSFL